MRCILAEKPSVALDIARALGGFQKHNGYLTVGSDTITWAYGHLVTLAAPEAYDPAWKTWAWTTLPMLPDKFQLQPIPKTASQLTLVTKLLRQADRIVCATDADREGELIFRYIYALAQVRKPVDRLWLSENTVPAIRKALAAMRPESAYNALAQAAQARAQADWLVGLNATRAFSLRHGQPGQPLSVGRVQTPTLHLVVERDTAIAQFQPVPYWQVTATFQAAAGEYTGRWEAPAGDHPDRIPTESQARALEQKLPLGTPGCIARIDTKVALIKPPFFFNLNDLQKEANRRMGLTAQQTLDAAQSLYDQHLISYPRTEARVLAQDVARTVGARLQALSVGSPALRAQAHSLLAQRLPRLVNDAAVAKAGHYAVIPTGQAPPGTLSARDQAVYDLIARRFLAALLPPGRDERTTIWTTAAGESFKTTGTVVLDPGWRAAQAPEDTAAAPKDAPDSEAAGPDDDSAADGPLPSGLQTGDAVTVSDTTVTGKQTKPPARMTDASLLALMEKHGLGTPATRARILEVLLAREYVRRDKKALISTEKGQHLLQVLPDILRAPDLTGEWEARLEAIATGHENAADFLAAIHHLTRDVVEAARTQTREALADPRTLGPCPVCHHGEIVLGRKAWGCSRWKEGCPFTIWKTVAGKKLTEAQVKTLLSGQPTPVLKGFKSKAGKAFDARLQLDNGKVVFVFARAHKSRPGA
jgi:DNA topoisomerase-3